MRNWLHGGVICFLGLVSLLSLQADEPAPQLGVRDQPLSPQDSKDKLELEAGYHLKLIAHEPDVVSPVDAAFDDRGRLWVVEMIDYPFLRPDQAEPRGRIRILDDKDGDGRFESSATFADKLVMPTGIGLWRDGALVTLGGQLVWMRDTDHDDQEDERQVWLEGFAQQNEQLRANHPRLEMDGRWYIACGLRGGKVQVGEALRGETPAEPIELGSRDVRLDPRTGRIEAITGPAQFGLTSDIVGSRMFCSNRNPCIQAVLEQSLLADNPLAGIVPAIHDALAAGEASRIYPLVDAWTTSNLHAGQFTAACGVHFQHVPVTEAMPDELVKRIHRDTLGRVYVCEPTGSLVHLQNVTHASALWQAEESDVESKTEWLASRDPWFRPVNVLSAPGSGVVVIDMQRAVIEHPEWVPDELKNRPDERFGEQAGRLYWIAESAKAWPTELLKELRDRPLGQRSVDEIVQLLKSDDPWLRRTSARLLIERDAVEAIPELLKLVGVSSQASVETQVLAWQLLSLFDPAARTHLEPQLTDMHRLIQITALRMLSRLPVTAAADGSEPQAEAATRTALQIATTTVDPWLRLEAIISAARSVDALNDQEAALAAEALGKTVAAHSDDPHLLVAAAGASKKYAAKFMLHWLDGLAEIEPNAAAGQVGIASARDRWMAAAARQLVAHMQKQEPVELANLVARVRYVLTEAEPVSDISRLIALTALHQHAKLLVAEQRGKKSSSGNPADAVAALDRPLWRKVRETARLTDNALPVRLAAIELLGLSQRRGDRQLLTELSTQSPDGPLRAAAIKAWGEQGTPAADDFLLRQVGTAGPGLRPVLIEQLLATHNRQVALLGLLKDGAITAKQLGAVELKRFVDRAQGEVKQGFQQQLDSILNSNRAAVLQQYTACMELSGDVARGKQVFIKQCAACHRVGDVGVQVGPDISDSRVHTADKLLTNILDPNRAIDNNYFRFVVLTNDGRTLDGIIAEETSDKVVLRSQNDQRHVLNRADIDQLKATGVSMMPEGLESQIDQQSMADLIAFIKNWRYTGGQVPSTVKAGK